MALITSLTSYYQLDTSPGLLVDSHGSRTLTNTGSTPTTTGILNQAGDFNTSRMLSYSTVSPPTGAFSLSAWVYPTSSHVGVIAAEHQESSSTAWQIFVVNGVDIYCRVHSGSTGAVYIGRKKTSALTLNAWNHVVVTWSGGGTAASIKIYVNGMQVDDTDDNQNTFTVISTIAVPFTIGAQFAAGGGSIEFGFNGRIDEVSWWEERELTHFNVKSLFNNGAANAYPIVDKLLFDTTTVGTYQTVNNYTLSTIIDTAGEDRGLVIAVSIFGAVSAVNYVKYNGVSASFIGAQNVSTTDRVELWYLSNPATGTHNVEVDFSGVTVACCVTAVPLVGTHQVSFTEGFASASATNVGAADATVNCTTVADGDIIIAVVATSDTSVSAGTGVTQEANVSGTLGSHFVCSRGYLASTTSYTMSATGVGALATWAIAAIAIRPVTASAGTSAISGSSVLVFGTGTCTLSGSGTLTGSSTVAFTTGTCTLSSSGTLTGSSAVAFATGTCTLAGRGVLAGTSAITFSPGNSTLLGSGLLAGTSSLTITATASPYGALSHIVGSSVLAFTSLATIHNLSEPTYQSDRIIIDNDYARLIINNG